MIGKSLLKIGKGATGGGEADEQQQQQQGQCDQPAS